MAKVVCTLPNAGDNINGVNFAPVPGVGMVSVDDLDAEALATFLSIPGYAEFDGGDSEPPKKTARSGKAAKVAKAENAGDGDEGGAEQGVEGEGVEGEGGEQNEETPAS